MKKQIIVFLSAFIFVISMLTGCSGSFGNLKKVRLHEAAHSIFYAPQYVAIEKGYFKEENIELEIVTSTGSDVAMIALVSGDADVALMGPESAIYLYNEGVSDYAISFAQLTQRAGNFLVSSQKIDGFVWDHIKGSNVLGERHNSMPEVVFEHVLKKNGIDPVSDLTIEKTISHTKEINKETDTKATNTKKTSTKEKNKKVKSNSEEKNITFSDGNYNFSIEFEPQATVLENAGKGYIVASLGVDSGYIPYTAYHAKKSYLEQNADLMQGFANALKKGVNYVNSHSPKEIAKVIAPQFKNLDLESIEVIVKRYQDQETWKNDLIFEEESFDMLQNILEDAGVLQTRVPYAELIDTKYTKQEAK